MIKAVRLLFAPSLAMTLCVLLALVVLFALGTWQARKIGPKDAYIDQITKAMQAGEIDLPAKDSALSDNLVEAYDLARVKADITLLDRAPLKLFNTNQQGKSGYHLYMPGALPGGEYMLVNIGWIPFELTDIPALPVSQPLTLTGILRQSAKPGMMQIDNDPASDIWYLADIDQMADYFKLDQAAVYPLRLFADQLPLAVAGQRYPIGGQLKMQLVNKHREYAFTWFGIAGALLVVYGAFGVKRAKTLKNTDK